MDQGEDGAPKIRNRPLHLLTIEIVLTDLIAGEEISCDHLQTYKLGDLESRKVLNWYRLNRAKWASNLQLSDCEALISALGAEFRPVQPQYRDHQKKRKLLRVAKIIAHRFAGLHAYGSTDNAPEHFIFQPEKPITLFEGWNGSGKTSIANAFIWCLTGQLLRAQRPPESGDQEFSCQIERSDVETSDHLISPVTPLPTSDVLSKHIPVDTWVEIVFVDEDGNFLPPFRRTQSRKPSGKLVESVSDPAVLDIDPISYRLGTTIPGMLSFVQIGSASELGTAVARLTGLADLIDLSSHALKARDRIGGPILKERREQLVAIELQFNQVRGDLGQRINEFPSMAPKFDLPLARDSDSIQKITELNVHFQKLKAHGLLAVKDILGESFDVENQKSREDLEVCIVPALEQIKKAASLPSIDRLVALKLEDQELANVREMLLVIQTEAAVLDELISNPTLAKRSQLYARISNWLAENNEKHDENCVVCRSSVKGLIDPETGISITVHLEQISQNSQLISKTVSEWASNWTGMLSRDLPHSLRNEIKKDLPKSPARLLYSGWVDDLFKTEAFKGTLATLQPGVDALAKKELAALPRFEEPDIIQLPENVQSHCSELLMMLNRIQRAIAFIEWKNRHKDLMNGAFNAIRRGSPDDEASQSIGSKLDALNLIVQGVAPITAAINLSERMGNTLALLTKKNDQITACITATSALQNIIPLGELAQEQVNYLRSLLHSRSEYWRNLIYQSATTFSPKVKKTGMNAKGIINMHVGRDRVSAPAQHVSNASALRASLFAFYLAFREHVLETVGGLRLLILDDPQDLLDHDNRQRLARAITSLANGGAQILATSHDRNFARTLVSESRSADLITHCSVHPVNASRNTIEISLAVEELDRKRTSFLKNEDSASTAQDYANEARIFLEARIGDLFDDPAYPAYSTITKAPTLNPLFSRLRGLVNGKANELFRSPVLQSFCNDKGMQDGAEARRILNQSHHDKASISYADVQRVDEDLCRIRSRVESVHEEFRRYRWRESMSSNNLIRSPVSLKAVIVGNFKIPVCQDIAAFTGNMSEVDSQDSIHEWFDNKWFSDKTLFYVRYDTLGFSIPRGSIAIAEADSSVGSDHSLVIARKGKQTFARRLVRSKNAGVISLCAEATDPRNSRPTLSFDEQQIETYKIVGALFVVPPSLTDREEASEIEYVSEISKIEIAFRVREESAVPLALPHQVALAGKMITAQDLDNMHGQLVAVTINEGVSLLKRVGSRLPKPLSHFRQFESIGGLGESVVIAMEKVNEGDNVAHMLYARPIIGIIYDF